MNLLQSLPAVRVPYAIAIPMTPVSVPVVMGAPLRIGAAPLPVAPAPVQVAAAAPLEVRYYRCDGSVFVDGDYLIKGVAGAIFWKVACNWAEHGRGDFTTRELRLAGAELRLPELQDNLDVRLLLLRRRLESRGGPLRIEKTGRGRFRFVSDRALRLTAAPV